MNYAMTVIGWVSGALGIAALTIGIATGTTHNILMGGASLAVAYAITRGEE